MCRRLLSAHRDTNLSLRAARRAQVEGVRVVPELRGRGAGTALMHDAQRCARAMNCGLLQLTTNKLPADAHRFYERLGFTPSHIGFKRELT